MPACWPGTAAGAWLLYEWELLSQNITVAAAATGAASSSASINDSCPPLQRFIRVDPKACGHKVPSTVPNAGHTNLPSCCAANETLLTSELANASVLLIGDSTSAQLLWHGCEAFRSRPRSFVPINNVPSASLRPYTHRLRSLDNHACKLPGNITFGSFSHYGATGPPYWVFAYPLAPWLANTTVGMVRKDMPRFRTLTTPVGSDPTLIVASSGFWDIAAWWAYEGNFSKRWSLNSNHTARYVTGVRRLVRDVRRAFPRSAVIWRLMHPGLKHSITPRVVSQLNAAIRMAAPSWRLPLIDTEAMIASLSKARSPNMPKGPPYGTQDGRHLHPWLNIALLNLVLNVASHVVQARAHVGEGSERVLPYMHGGGGLRGGGARAAHSPSTPDWLSE